MAIINRLQFCNIVIAQNLAFTQCGGFNHSQREGIVTIEENVDPFLIVLLHHHRCDLTTHHILPLPKNKKP